MRIGCCLDLTKDARQGFAQAKQLLAAGFDFLEANLTSLATIPQEEYEALKAAVNALGLPVPACNCMLPKEIRIVSPDVDEAALHEYVERAFSRAAGVGVEKAVLGSDKSRQLPPEADQDAAYGEFIAMVRKHVVPACEKYGITVVIEPLRVPCNFINTLADGMRVVRGVDHPQVRLLADTIHVMTSRENIACVREFKPFIRHVHVSDWERELPEFTYSSELTALLREIKQSGYDGDYSFEARPGRDEKGSQRALLLLRQKLR